MMCEHVRLCDRKEKEIIIYIFQYAVLELPTHDDFNSVVYYAVPACTAWLENITMKVSPKKDKRVKIARVTYAAICKWPPDETKLSDYLEKKKKPTDIWITYENVQILKFCSKYNIFFLLDFFPLRTKN